MAVRSVVDLSTGVVSHTSSCIKAVLLKDIYLQLLNLFKFY